MSARDRILGRVREALAERKQEAHPGPFGGWRSEGEDTPAVDRFIQLFEAAGGEVVRFDHDAVAAAWVRDFVSKYDAVSMGRLARWPTAVGAESPELVLKSADPADSDVGVSLAYGAVAETGSLIMTPQDGRRAQLLPPVHVVWVEEKMIFPMLYQALSTLGKDLPSAVGLHSGPSKSADIGQILVKGVHGPGRLIAVLLADKRNST